MSKHFFLKEPPPYHDPQSNVIGKCLGVMASPFTINIIYGTMVTWCTYTCNITSISRAFNWRDLLCFHN